MFEFLLDSIHRDSIRHASWKIFPRFQWKTHAYHRSNSHPADRSSRYSSTPGDLGFRNTSERGENQNVSNLSILNFLLFLYHYSSAHHIPFLAQPGCLSPPLASPAPTNCLTGLHIYLPPFLIMDLL